ncbi:cupin-like domain-containing protein [Thamnocephalis sphaerospora]|uniref:Cupin-like domain-containing protein n=1 Tax=Thamnocephalis sphaerospora TaxID=78915 RepID=A0A4P9XSU8_9FUNG|nr:cupin-like domain-containing protein [Thamnocephalis sphaerospora]|eukprot:RKP09052.1 cupin-like domain-containing protein [Thamnocephalis sphaerospora]
MADQRLRRQLHACLQELVVNGQELAGTESVLVLDGPPTPLEFYRLVAANRPALVKNATHGWPAMQRWRSDAYLANTLGADTVVTVAATPHGYADAVVEDRWFAEPAERPMRLRDFMGVMRAELVADGRLDQVQLDTLHRDPQDPTAADVDRAVEDEMAVQAWWARLRQQYPGVHYVQSQNGNLAGEFAPLAADVPASVDFATEALGKEPDAVNFWMGTGRSVTSLHKDPYENLYAVMTGAKVFTLLPPTTQPCLYERDYEHACYRADTLALEPTTPPQRVPWIPVDPTRPDLERFPRYANARPLTVRVEPGDMLYLPAMWFHHVQQEGRTVAVNWWYDMDYGAAYAYLMMVRGVSRALRRAEHESGLCDDSEDDQDGDGGHATN